MRRLSSPLRTILLALGLGLGLGATLGANGTAKAATPPPSDVVESAPHEVFQPSVRTFDTKFIERETLTASTLESLLNERIERVIRAAGIPQGESSSASTVHIVKQKKPDPSDARTSEAAAKKKKSEIFDAPFSSFPSHSMLDADDLIDRFELANPESPEEIDRKRAERYGSLDDGFQYIVKSIAIQAAISDRFSPEIRGQVEKALHQSFDGILTGDVKIEVVSFAQLHTFWLTKVLRWTQRLQPVAISMLLLIGAISLLLLSRKVPSWQAREALKTSHEQKESVYNETAEKKKDKDAEATTTGMSDAEMAAAVAAVHREILVFASTNPQAADQVVGNWVRNGDSAAKISYFAELLSKNGLTFNAVELRNDQFQALQEYKARAKDLPLAEQLRVSKEIFWDTVSSRYFKRQAGPNPFEFLTAMEDSVVAEALRNESDQAKAQIIGSLSERRAAAIISKFQPEDKRRVMEFFFSGGTMNADEVSKLAARMKQRVDKLGAAHRSSKSVSKEALSGILANMDFASQFALAQGFLNLDPIARNAALASYFNVALLPLVRNSMIEKLFVDRTPEFMKNILSQFDSTLLGRVMNVLPPMQKRMMEGVDLSGVSKAAAMVALKELNDEILQKLERKEIAFEDIFDFQDTSSGGFSAAGGGDATSPSIPGLVAA